MVSRPRHCRKPEGIRFAPTPWNSHSPAYEELDRRLPSDHLARRIAAAVARLDLAALERAYVGAGSAPYRPDLLLRVVLYELRRGKRRPTEWARDAREHEPARWLLLGCEPRRSCWYDFRDRLGPLVLAFNRQILEQALDQELTPATRGALDGTLVAARASRHRLVSEATLQQRVPELAQAVAVDQDQEAPAEVPGWMAPTTTGRQRQQQRYDQAQTRMAQLQQRNQQKRASKRKARDRIVVSTSDPEAALGLDKHKVYRPLYNVQLVDDLDSPLILGYGVFAQPNDAGTLGPMLERLTDLLGHKVEILLADAGYASGDHLALAAAAGLTLYAPWQENDATRGKRPPARQIPKQEFRWLAEEQTYVCPQHHRLQALGPTQQKRSGTERVVLYQYRCAPEHCCACPLQKRCTSNPEAGRTISRGEHEDLIEALRVRMQTPEAKALYRQRRQTVELAHADLKEHRQLHRFSGWGQDRAQTEVGLLVLVHNLLTVLAADISPKLEDAWTLTPEEIPA